MVGEPVPPEHSIVRYCKPSSLNEGTPGAASFARKPAHRGVSVNEIEGAQEIKAEVSAAKRLMTPWLKMGASGRMAVLPVKAVLAIDAAPQLIVYREPQTDPENVRPPNPRHSEIGNVPSEDDMQAGRTSVLLALVAAVSADFSVSDV